MSNTQHTRDDYDDDDDDDVDEEEADCDNYDNDELNRVPDTQETLINSQNNDKITLNMPSSDSEIDGSLSDDEFFKDKNEEMSMPQFTDDDLYAYTADE